MEPQDNEEDKSTVDMQEMMGFGSFGKKARTFDLSVIFEQTRRTAMERSQKTWDKLEEEKSDSAKMKSGGDSDDDLIGPPVPKTGETAGVSDSEDEIGPPLPPGFQPAADDDDADEIGPPLPPGFEPPGSDSEQEEEEDSQPKIPASHEIELQHGNKAVSALAMDPSGARLVTGGIDYEISLWDFAGMDASLRSFRTLQPCECHPIKSVQYSVTGDTILVVSGNAQAKVLDRDGHNVMECVKGDPYISDMVNTKGHISMLNDGCWHPKEREEFMTCSYDCTVRLWNVNVPNKHKNVIKPRQQNGLKVVPTVCSYSRDGKTVACCCQDGSIQMWDHRKNFVNTSMVLRNAHTNGTDTSCISFSYDGRQVLSRGCDDTMKLWDLRQFKKPVHVANDLYNRFSMTDCTFSPDDQMVVTGTSSTKTDKIGRLVFFDRNSFNKVNEIEVTNSSVVRVVWHPKLNQIVTGCGNGIAKLYYDPDKSHRGAMLCVVKTKRKSKQVEMVVQQQVITPHALPLFREDRPRSTKKQMEKARKDPVKSKRPDLPVTGPGQGGRIAAAGGTLSSYIIRNLGIKKKIEDDQDPREAILKYAKEAAENPYWVSPAYQQNQPKPVFQEPDLDDEGEEREPLGKKAKN